MSNCDFIDLKAKGDVLFGYVYAPEADLNVYAKNGLSGAFCGKSMTIYSGTDFTYIPPTFLGGGDPASYLMLRWWEE